VTQTAPLRFENHYPQLGEAFGSVVPPTPLRAPRLLHVNRPLLAELGLDLDDASLLAICNGERALAGAAWFAQVYAGHQFGVFVPRLGDGRAVLLGTIRDPQGRAWDLHLKGGGPTPYSRGGDGRAVLRSSVREYLASEALHGLGIPTTRALCLVASDHPVRREQPETGALVLRVAPSFVRFGTFEYFARRGETEHVRLLADHVLAQHLPELEPGAYVDLLGEAVARTARLVADWQAFGFAHGVLNTDNMSILGLTLDYGPYGWVESLDPAYVCNHSDPHGRYAFGRQPDVGMWNLLRLAEALRSLVPPDAAQEALGRYGPAFVTHYRERLRARLDLPEWRGDDDDALVHDLLDLLVQHGADLTRTFRALARWEPCGPTDALREEIPAAGPLDAWLARYARRLAGRAASPDHRRRALASNPKFVLRNYLAQQAIDAAARDDSGAMDDLLTVLRDPWAEHDPLDRLAGPTPEWGRQLVISCSS
jgi:uncharacterized protein YdiU (UPF0061 family)